jgi:heat shock protein HslJ
MPKPGRSPSVALLVVVGLLVVGCDSIDSSPSGGTPDPRAPTDLAGTSWTVVRIGESDTLESARPTLTFEPGRQATGSTGCNSFGGAYVLDGTSLAFGLLAVTKRACADAGRMTQESALLEALSGVTACEIDEEGRLHLSGTNTLVLAAADS